MLQLWCVKRRLELGRMALTQCFQQQLDAGLAGSQSCTHGWVGAHVGQHPDQLHQHVLVLHRHGRQRQCSAGSALVALVQLQERARAALALKELPPRGLHFGGEVTEGEKKSHDEVLRGSRRG